MVSSNTELVFFCLTVFTFFVWSLNRFYALPLVFFFLRPGAFVSPSLALAFVSFTLQLPFSELLQVLASVAIKPRFPLGLWRLSELKHSSKCRVHCFLH